MPKEETCFIEKLYSAIEVNIYINNSNKDPLWSIGILQGKDLLLET